MSEADDEVLRSLQQRLRRASDATESLIAEAGARIRAPADGRPASAASPDGDEDVERLVGLARRLVALVPPDIQRRLTEALRELLLAVRAVIDWYLDRLDRRPAGPSEVTDIPIL